MTITARSYLTAGIAALGVGAVALSPIQPLPTHGTLASEKAVSNLAVQLASSIDPITPWVDTFKTAGANVKALFDFYASNPSYTSPLGLDGNFSAVFPLAQTLIANQMTYFQELTTGNAAVIPQQILNNVKTFFNAPWSPGAMDDKGNYEGEYISSTVVTYGTLKDKPILPVNQQFAFQLLPDILGDSWEQLKPIVDFTATYYSGQVVGLLGPVFAPLIELTRSFTAVGELFNAGDVTGAINELINIPANITNAVLNGGGYLDLTGVVNAIQPLPDEVESIGINLGGLISPPVPQDGSLVQPDPLGLPAPTTYDGGTAFDSVATKVTAMGLKVDDPGIPVSWVGAAVGLGQFLGQEMLVTPPQAPATAASVSAAAEPEALPAAAAAVAEAPADVAAVADAKAASAPEAEAPAAAPERNAAATAGSANSSNDTATKASSRGMSRSAHARGAE